MIDEDEEDFDLGNKIEGSDDIVLPESIDDDIVLPDLDTVEYTPTDNKSFSLPDAVDDDGNHILDDYLPPVEVDDYNYRNVKYGDYDSGRGTRSNEFRHPDDYSDYLEGIQPYEDSDDNSIGNHLPDDFIDGDDDSVSNDIVFDNDDVSEINTDDLDQELSSFDDFSSENESFAFDNINDLFNDKDDNKEQDDPDKYIDASSSSRGFSSFINEEDIDVSEDLDDEELLDKYFDIDVVLDYAIEQGASDLHLNADDYVALTINTSIIRVKKFGILSSSLLRHLMLNIISNVLESDFTNDLELDTSYVVRTGRSKGRRSRLNIAKSLNNISMTFRIVSDVIPVPDDLGIPQVMQDWIKLPSGLIMVNGPTGTGKAVKKNTKIPTFNKGLVNAGDVIVGDLLLDEKENPTKVIDIHPSKDVKHFEFSFNNGQKIKTAGNHLWKVKSLNKNFNILQFRVLSDEDYYKARNIWNLLNSVLLNSGVSIKNNGLYKMSEIKKLFNFSNFEMLELVIARDCSVLDFYVDGERVFDLFEVVSVLLDDYDRKTVESNSLDNSYILTSFEIFNFGILDGLDYNWVVEKPSLVDKDSVSFYIDSVVEIDDSVDDYICFEVDSDSHLYLATESFIPTHNTTTLASLLNSVNLNEPKKIVTVENPIEFLYGSSGKGLVVQREIGKDARSFSKALNSAMRQNPDIILIGEVRDRTEIDALVRSAESGHLAVSTMHTTSAPMTISRIMSLYVGDEQSRILGTLADVSRGFANQTLLKRKDGNGMVAVREVLPITIEVSDLIRDGNINGLRNYQIDNKITIEHELIKEVIKDTVTLEEAKVHSAYPAFFDDLAKKEKL